MRKVVLISLVGVLILGGTFFGLASPHKKSSIKWSLLSVFGDQTKPCFDLFSERLKDPYTAVIEDSHLHGSALSIQYRSKNSFGAYNPGVVKCAVNDGKLDELATKIDWVLAR